MYESAVKLMAKQQVALEVLSYHATAQHDEVEKLKVGEICLLLILYGGSESFIYHLGAGKKKMLRLLSGLHL